MSRRLVHRACAEGIEALEAVTLPDNIASQAVLTKLGFEFREYADGLAEFHLPLRASVCPAVAAGSYALPA